VDPNGVYVDAMSEDDPHLKLIERVLCLECGLVYGKPAAGGTTLENPGCPTCGYVGWIAVRDHGDDEDKRPLRQAG
jgi:hypothetical protein